MHKKISLKSALSGSLFLYIILTGLLIWRVPLGASPDESAHWDYIAYVAENHSLPVFKVTKAPDYGYEFHQPPLYYVLNVPLWKVFNGGDGAKYAARILSLICGATTIFLLWNSLKVLFPTKPEFTIFSTLFAGLWPLHQTVGASGGNDAMTGLISALLLWVIAKSAHDGWTWKHSIYLGIFTGIGILTKTSSLVPAVAAFGGAVHLLWRGHKNNRNSKSTFMAIAPQIAVAILVTLATGGWWLVRNQMLYGDPLAMDVFQKAFAQSSPSPFIFFAAGVGVFTYLRALLSISFCTFWGLFGGPNTALQVINPFGSTGAKPVALLAFPLALIFSCVTLLGIWGIWKALCNGFDKSTLTRVALAWWMIEFVLVIFSWVQFNITQFQGQARYIHPAMLPIAAGLCYGWIRIWGTGNKKLYWASAIVGISMIATTLWNVLGWRTLV